MAGARRRVRAARPALALAILLAALAAAPALGQSGGSIGAAPGTVSVADAQPGQTTRARVTVQNQFAEPTTFTVTRNGTAGDWTTVEPAGPVTVPARSQRSFELAIAVPDGTGPGERTGQVTFTTEPKEDPDGSGPSVRRAVGVHLRVTVGGTPREALAWLDAAAADARVGDTLLANATARNDGNVRTAATAHASVTALGGGPVLAQGEGTVELDPGQSGVAAIPLGDDLPVGQYTVTVVSRTGPAFERVLDVKVTATGVAPDGRLRAISNEARVPAGEPATLSGWFENTGDVPIAGARMVLEVRRDGVVLATLASAERPLDPGAHANLTAIWTPPRSGTYVLVGHVEYDGFRTPDVEGRLQVERPAPDFLWLVWVLLAGVVVLFLVLWWRRRRERERRKGRSQDAAPRR